MRPDMAKVIVERPRRGGRIPHGQQQPINMEDHDDVG